VDAQAQLEKDGALKSRPHRPARHGDGGNVAELKTDEDEQPEEAEAGRKRRKKFMAREIITIECSEARKEGKPPLALHDTRTKTEPDKLSLKSSTRFCAATPCTKEINNMPRKTNTEKDKRGNAARRNNAHSARSRRLTSPKTRSISRHKSAPSICHRQGRILPRNTRECRALSAPPDKRHQAPRQMLLMK